jgi:ribonuclease HII
LRSDLRDFDLELRRQFYSDLLIGVDEAGRGPLAGPVLVAAVCLDEDASSYLTQARDSKLLSPKKRTALAFEIRRRALKISVAWAHPSEIDRLNIFKATMAAMFRASQKITRIKQFPVIVDGPFAIPGFLGPQMPIIKGDRKSLAVACASIIAKVYRDHWMEALDRKYPKYGFSRHKGYGTQSHLAALRSLGPSLAHRRSYAPVMAALRPHYEIIGATGRPK